MRLRLPSFSAGALLLLAAALPAAAQPAQRSQTPDRPPPAPTQDVAVAYRMAAGQSQEMRVAWLTGEERTRLDMANQGYMVIDLREQRAFMVMQEQRMVMEIPFAHNTQRMAQLPRGARLTREGQDRVAGTPCTVWAYQEAGQTGRSCITEDGVLLRVVSAAGPEESMEAVSVAYGPQDPIRFRPPAHFTTLAMPALPGPGAPGPVAGPADAVPASTSNGFIPFASAPAGPPGRAPARAAPFSAPPPPPMVPVGVGLTSGSSSPNAAKPPNAVPQRTR